MASQQDIHSIISALRVGVAQIFQQEYIDVILFGSYARGDYDEESDIDVLLLVDVPRQTIFERNWQIGELAAELLMEYGIVVSPIVENRQSFEANSGLLPFFRNIRAEGIRLSA